MYIFIVKAALESLPRVNIDHDFLLFIPCVYTRLPERVGPFQEKHWDAAGKSDGRGQHSTWNKVERRESTWGGDKKSRRIILEIPQEVVSYLLGVIASDLSQGYKPSLVSLFLIYGSQAFSWVTFMHICSLATFLRFFFPFKVVAMG